MLDLQCAGISSSPSAVCVHGDPLPSGTTPQRKVSMSCRTLGSQFSLMVRLHDVCCTKRLSMPTFTFFSRGLISSATSLVTRWQPRRRGERRTTFCCQTGAVVGGMALDNPRSSFCSPFARSPPQLCERVRQLTVPFHAHVPPPEFAHPAAACRRGRARSPWFHQPVRHAMTRAAVLMARAPPPKQPCASR